MDLVLLAECECFLCPFNPAVFWLLRTQWGCNIELVKFCPTLSSFATSQHPGGMKATLQLLDSPALGFISLGFVPSIQFSWLAEEDLSGKGDLQGQSNLTSILLVH